MTRRLTEYSPIIVKIPASSAGILSFVQKKPVITPETHPAAQATRIAAIGVYPEVEPLIGLSFLALPVIPELKLTDSGLFDVVKFQFI